MIRLTRIDHDQNMSRYYQLHIQPRLFGGCDLVREWGRNGWPGTVRADLYEDQAAANAALVNTVARRRKRGYQAVKPTPFSNQGARGITMMYLFFRP